MSIADKLTTIAENEQKVFEAGKQAEYDSFWDFVTQNGTRTIYRYAFAGASWNAETFTLNRPIRVGAGITTAQGMFWAFNSPMKSGELPEAVDFTKFSKLIDFSSVTNAPNMFEDARIVNLTADLKNVTNLNRAFASSVGGDIDGLTLRVTEKCTSYSGTFSGASNLTTLIFTDDSVIAAAMNLSACTKLTYESLMSVINALATVSSAITLTLGSSNLAKLTDAEKAIATQKGWTIA